MKQPATYILASGKNGTIYTGVTSNLIQRVTQHKQNAIPGFTSRYGVKSLVWFELHETMEAAIHREKRLKSGSRAAKIQLIMASNPDWRDLYEDLL